MRYIVVPRAKYEKLIYKLECLLCHATGNKLSKHTYDLRTMESVVTDYLNDTYSEGMGDGYKSCAEEILAIIDQRQHLVTQREEGVKEPWHRGYYSGEYLAYQDIKEIIEQKYLEGKK